MDPHRSVCVGQPGVGPRVPRVRCNRFLEELDRLREPATRTLLPVITTLQIGTVRLKVLGGPFGQPLPVARCEIRLQGFSNVERQLRLKRENVGHASIVALGPEMEAVGRVDELGMDANPTAISSDTALEYRRDVQLPSYFANV